MMEDTNIIEGTDTIEDITVDTIEDTGILEDMIEELGLNIIDDNPITDFTYLKNTSKWAQKSVINMVSNRIVDVESDIDMGEKVTKEEVAIYLYRILEKSEVLGI